ncbi:SAVED domain-containing protein [Candidatus Poriferisocius sp.]|uniref:SAVED domain-containing protein n=1 Tax=Candidatus Poriferisocius sp. TaxID=3101276 RepID=UPI003B01CE2D
MGQTNSANSPRGISNLTPKERDCADNLILLCENCHNEVDKLAHADLFPICKMKKIKYQHEARIRAATKQVGSESTAIVRLSALIRDAPVEISAKIAANAILKTSDRFPSLRFTYDRQGVEIDLRDFPDESIPTDLYYQNCARRIDEQLDRIIRPAIRKGEIQHISVFAMARLPLLVYFGSRLDDTIDCDIYEPRSEIAPWIWGEKTKPVEFIWRCNSEPSDTSTEAVLVVNASGTTHTPPTQLAPLPTYTIEPVGETPKVGTVSSRATLMSFERILRDLLGELESSVKNLERLHVLAAAPVSVAITIGRSIGWGIHPNLVTYDLINKTYRFAMEITPP